MKKLSIRIISFLMAFGLSTGLLGGITLTAKAEDAGESADVYRLFNNETGEHIYTADYNEVKIISKVPGWINEGVKWYAPKKGIPVYRLYRQDYYHLYTTDPNEVNILAAAGWIVDNDGAPVFFSGGDVEIYRIYDSEKELHLLTENKKEYKILEIKGWQAEGVKLNAVSLPKPKKEPDTSDSSDEDKPEDSKDSGDEKDSSDEEDSANNDAVDEDNPMHDSMEEE